MVRPAWFTRVGQSFYRRFSVHPIQPITTATHMTAYRTGFALMSLI